MNERENADSNPRNGVVGLPAILLRPHHSRHSPLALEEVEQPRGTIRTAGVSFLAILALALAGCRSIDPKLITAMADNNAHIKVRVTSLYGTIEFERKMLFPPAPPAPATEAIDRSIIAPDADAPRPRRRAKPSPAPLE